MNTEMNAAQRENIADPAEAPKQEPATESKLFSQEEVDRIIDKRLKRARASWEKAAADGSSADPAAERERQIAARESRLDCREFLAENGHDRRLLDLFDTSDFETFKGKIDMLHEISQAVSTGKNAGDTPPNAGRRNTGFSHEGGRAVRNEADIAAAFKPKY